MDCNKIEERLLDLASGEEVPAPVSEHVAACGACSARLEGLRGTMAMLDAWQAPEPSPYFDQKLQVRIREVQAEEAASAPSGWLAWLRRPLAALAILAVFAVGLLMFRGGTSTPAPQVAQNQPAPAVQNTTAQAVSETSAVEDLEELDRNHDLYAEFDLLDELEPQQPVNR